MSRAYYYSKISDFITQGPESILGTIATNNQFVLEHTQRNTWLKEIDILQRELSGLDEGTIVFEYTIPRIGSRVDNILIYKGLVFLLEFKVGSLEYTKHAIDQVTDYALDLRNFHQKSHDRTLIPILVATRASGIPLKSSSWQKEGVHEVLLCNENNIRQAVDFITERYASEPFEAESWLNSSYSPTPTIIEAAQALYRNHSVEDISRNDASAYNLDLTTKAIGKIIDDSKRNHRKSICFITGVPGAGKTLAGLNIANSRHKFEEDEHAVFLSGNQPLVSVLQEALARDDSERSGRKKTDALKEAKAFIQIIHHFRDEAIAVETPLKEKVVIFDEAQRAWDAHSLERFMASKKGIQEFCMSEPEFLIRIMDRHQDWAVIICLVGGGQEINTGEAGISEWFSALRRKYPAWHVYISNQITDSEYSDGRAISELLNGLNYEMIPQLHLAVSLRSFRSEKVSEFIKALLDIDITKAKALYQELKTHYPIVITRSIAEAKDWVRKQAKGTERYGLVASSGAKRLRTWGIWVQSKIDAKNWFLNGQDDVRSCYFLEDTATEFDIQGLELDWTVVCWDANLRFQHKHWDFYNFTGSSWHTIHQDDARKYLLNAYRVLLTRARQGMIIFVPEGNAEDPSRQPEYYDKTYEYLQNILI